MNILFIIKVMILVDMKWSYRFPQLCELLNLEWLTYFEHVVQSFQKHVYFERSTCIVLRSTLISYYQTENGQKKDTIYDDIGLCAQNMNMLGHGAWVDTIISSKVNMIGMAICVNI